VILLTGPFLCDCRVLSSTVGDTGRPTLSCLHYWDGPAVLHHQEGLHRHAPVCPFGMLKLSEDCQPQQAVHRRNKFLRPSLYSMTVNVTWWVCMQVVPHLSHLFSWVCSFVLSAVWCCCTGACMSDDILNRVQPSQLQCHDHHRVIPGEMILEALKVHWIWPSSLRVNFTQSQCLFSLIGQVWSVSLSCLLDIYSITSSQLW